MSPHARERRNRAAEEERNQKGQAEGRVPVLR
jgi:hypothetical protein